MGCENSKTVRVQPTGRSAAAPSSSEDGTDPEATMGQEGSTQTPETQQGHQRQQRHRASFKLDKPDDGAKSDEQGNNNNTKVKASEKPQSPNNNNNNNATKTKKDLLLGSSSSSRDTLDEGGGGGGKSRTLLPRDSDRGCSAASKKSTDSGLGEDCSTRVVSISSNNEVSEESETQKKKVEEKVFRPRSELELNLPGQAGGGSSAAAGNNANDGAKESARPEEAQVMQSLREEGLISKAQLQSTGGMAFEIVAATSAADAERTLELGGRLVPKPPPRLEKLAVERGKKKKRALTEDEIRDKLERAERRRKRREQERLAKLRERERTDAVTALDNFVQYQKSKEETISQRMDQVQDNRERKLQELRDKQERRKRHAEEVRQRKALSVAENGTTNEAGGPLALPSREELSLSLKVTPRPEMATRLEVSSPSAQSSSVQREDVENPGSSSRNSSSRGGSARNRD